jgi:hypothetical protein
MEDKKKCYAAILKLFIPLDSLNYPKEFPPLELDTQTLCVNLRKYIISENLDKGSFLIHIKNALDVLSKHGLILSWRTSDLGVVEMHKITYKGYKLLKVLCPPKE